MKFFLYLFLAAPLCAAQITIDGTMSLVWQYDLHMNQFNTVNISVMPVQVVINESVPTGSNGRYTVGNVSILAPLYAPTPASIGSASIWNEPSWNETWITLEQDFSSDARWMEFNNGALMTNPDNFTSAEFESILFSQIHVGGSWGMRDDGQGLQNLLGGTISTITVTSDAPEPATYILMLFPMFLIWKRSK